MKWIVTKIVGNDICADTQNVISVEFDYSDKDKAYALLKQWKHDEYMNNNDILDAYIALY